MIRVFIVGEIRLYREGLAYALSRSPGISVVGTAAAWGAGTGPRGSEAAEVILLDMATDDGFATLRAMLAARPASKVVALAVPDAEEELLASVEAGASGYVTREGSFETMVASIESVAHGELLTTPRMAAVLLRRVSALTSASRPGEGERLTPREREIVTLIDEGCSNKVIAQRLNIELSTVKNHVHNILEKLQVHRRGEAAARLRTGRLQSAAHSRD